MTYPEACLVLVNTFWAWKLILVEVMGTGQKRRLFSDFSDEIVGLALEGNRYQRQPFAVIACSSLVVGQVRQASIDWVPGAPGHRVSIARDEFIVARKARQEVR